MMHVMSLLMTSEVRNREVNVARKFHDVHHTMQLRINVKCRELHSSLIGLADRLVRESSS